MRKMVKTRNKKYKSWKLGRLAVLVVNGTITSITALSRRLS